MITPNQHTQQSEKYLLCPVTVHTGGDVSINQKMKILHCLLIAIISCATCVAQNDTVRKGYDDIEDLKTQIEQNEIVELEYIDSIFKYRVSIPNWLTIMETRSPRTFGGVLPAVEGVENAIMVTGFPKTDFKDFEEFKDIYLTGNRFGQPVKWGSGHGWMGQNELIEIDHGWKQKVFLFWENLIYHSQFVLLESDSAFLWIQFMASPETYDKNIGKFEEFMDRLELLN